MASNLPRGPWGRSIQSGQPRRPAGAGKAAGSATALAALLAAAGGLVVWRKANAERNAEAALWADATDPID